jgi:hypothetical protein
VTVLHNHSRRPPLGCPVVLVSMPFAFLETPSIGLSLLRAQLGRIGIPAKVHYATLDFGRRVGPTIYDAIAVRPGMSYLAGEWLFSGALLGTGAIDLKTYTAAIKSGELGKTRSDVDEFLEQLSTAHAVVDEFLSEWCTRILDDRPAIVGFTSVFQQHIASLALAARLKEANPEIVTVLGGPNCDDTIGVETARQFDCIDAVVYGEADELFPELVSRVLGEEPFEDLVGLYTTAKARATSCLPAEFPSTNPVEALDDVADPRYEDFLAQLEAAGFRNELRPELLLETSRGCWWGEKHHCVFCGLNDVTMGYRHKSADVVLTQLEYLRRIAPHARVGPMQAIYFETKANLTKAHIQGFYRAGIRTIQPGIESFITRSLKLMDKGVSGAQNVALLRMCEELGVQVMWNHLWGIPGEYPEDYHDLARQIPRLAHLQPPEWMGEIAILRFSPLQVTPERFGIRTLRYARVYDYIYPTLPNDAKLGLAYYFDPEFAEFRDVEGYTRPLQRAITAWREAHHGSILFWIEQDEAVVVWDTRPVAVEPVVALTEARRDAFLAFIDPRPVERVAASLEERYEGEKVRQAIDEIGRRGFVFEDTERWVNVAVSLAEYPSESATHQSSFIRAQKLALLDRVRELTGTSMEPIAA